MSKSSGAFVIFPLSLSGIAGGILVTTGVVFLVSAILFVNANFHSNLVVLSTLKSYDSWNCIDDGMNFWIGLVGTSIVGGMILFGFLSIYDRVLKSMGKTPTLPTWRDRMISTMLIIAIPLFYFSIAQRNRLTSPKEVYQLGEKAMQENRTEDAEVFFLRARYLTSNDDPLALKADLSYGLLCERQAMEYQKEGDTTNCATASNIAFYTFQDAIAESDSSSAEAYVGIANVLFIKDPNNNSHQIVNYIKKAAQLGNVSAQEWLAQHGYTSK